MGLPGSESGLASAAESASAWRLVGRSLPSIGRKHSTRSCRKGWLGQGTRSMDLESGLPSGCWSVSSSGHRHARLGDGLAALLGPRSSVAICAAPRPALARQWPKIMIDVYSTFASLYLALSSSIARHPDSSSPVTASLTAYPV